LRGASGGASCLYQSSRQHGTSRPQELRLVASNGLCTCKLWSWGLASREPPVVPESSACACLLNRACFASLLRGASLPLPPFWVDQDAAGFPPVLPLLLGGGSARRAPVISQCRPTSWMSNPRRHAASPRNTWPTTGSRLQALGPLRALVGRHRTPPHDFAQGHGGSQSAALYAQVAALCAGKLAQRHGTSRGPRLTACPSSRVSSAHT
jgi:hypothetical protein